MKKILLLILVLTMTSLAACGKSSSKSSLSIFLYHEDIVYSEDMAVFKLANDYAGVKLTGFLQKYDSDYRNRFITGGYKANLVSYDQDTIESYGLNGTYVDLTNLIEEHAPNMKAYFDANPEKKAWATASNGAIYGIPFYTDGLTAKGFFVRQDWVDILLEAQILNSAIYSDLNNLTVQQFEDLLRAFKDNSNLLSDREIVPYFDRDEEYFVSELASLWNGTAEFYVDDEGTVRFGAVEQEFKTAIENIARWYKDGLIDPNILDGSKNDDRQTYFARNTGGATHDWIGSTYAFNADVYSDVMVEGFEIQAIAPMIRLDNTRLEPTIRKKIGQVTAIYSKTSEADQIKLIKWMDYFFSKEGQDALNFGIENVTYTKSGDKYTYTDAVLNDRNTALANLYKYGAQLQSPGVQNFDYEEAWLDPDAAAAMAMYENNEYLNLDYDELIYPNIKLTANEYKTVNAARTQITYEMNQQLYQWIINKQAVNGISSTDWQEFVQLLKTSGYENIINIYQGYVDAK